MLIQLLIMTSLVESKVISIIMNLYGMIDMLNVCLLIKYLIFWKAKWSILINNFNILQNENYILNYLKYRIVKKLIYCIFYLNLYNKICGIYDKQ